MELINLFIFDYLNSTTTQNFLRTLKHTVIIFYKYDTENLFPKLTPVTIRRTLLSGGLQQVNLISGIQDTTSVPIIRRFTSLPPNLKKKKVLWTMVALYDNTSTSKYIVIHLLKTMYCDMFTKYTILQYILYFNTRILAKLLGLRIYVLS